MDNREASDPLVRLSQRILTEAKQWELMQNKYKNNENPIYDYMSSRKRRSISSKK
ncbi:unnamed protein product [Medioppia subpectinata]|uniref:Uncharacterized protein n=1 Tax=Medioppia subpectinata TaxID=1979941 RepID=A0A7R9QLF0_9ACAR|nr:unnamed protein product [Medioppia subpectinata]CAG2122582.1 unnamed protein product [Medioppia subpectinata]